MNYFDDVGSHVCDSPEGVTGHLRRKYRKPALEKLGDLRTMTLGGSPGTGDSGGGGFVTLPYSGDKIIPDFPMPDEFQQPGNQYIPPL